MPKGTWNAEYRFKWRAKKKKYIYDYLSTHPCEHCGESRPVCLEFHHTDSNTKEISLADACNRKIERIQNEIDKCQVLCCNCHRIVTAKELGRYNFLNTPD